MIDSKSDLKIKVYCGLSIDEVEVKAVLPHAICSKPIVRYDLLEDVDSGFNVVIIFDGSFYQKLSVSPSEIMDGLRCGIKIFGASSMGALRAVECEKYGMVGCGKIFDFIRSNSGFRDDLIAQAYDEESGKPLQLSYMDLLFGFENWIAQGRCTKNQADQILNHFVNIYFAERSFQSLKAELEKKNQHELVSIAEKVFSENFSQKQIDAVELLGKVKNYLHKTEKTNRHIWQIQKSGKVDENDLTILRQGIEGLSTENL